MGRDFVPRWGCSLLLAAIGLAACQKREIFAVDQIVVRGVSAETSPLIAPSQDEAELLLRQAFERSGGFKLSATPQSHGSGLRVEATIGTADSELAVFLSVVRKNGDEGDDQFEVEGAGPEGGSSLDKAMDEAVAAAHFKLTAPKTSERELLREAAAPGREGRSRREAALDELVRRHSPKAEAFLLERLRSGDPIRVRRAIGSLVELRQASSVPSLIELAHGQDEMFVRELIFALGAIGGEEARAYLFTVAQGHDQPETRAAAGEALRELEKQGARKK